MSQKITAVAVRGVAFVVLLGSWAGSAQAVVVAKSDNPQNFGSVAANENRFFLFGGWTGESDLIASDGNEFAAFRLDSNDAGYNSGNNGAGFAWHIDKDQYETAGANSVGGEGLGTTLANGHVLRNSVWIATDALDPLVTDGTFTHSYKFEMSVIRADGGGSEVMDTAADDPPGIVVTWAPADCDLGTNVCTDNGQVSASGWTRISMVYEIDDFWFTGSPSWATATIDDVLDIRPVLFVGDFSSGETEHGTLYYDSPVVEVFANMTDLNNTPLDSVNPNPGGHVPVTGIAGDYNGDGFVGQADLDLVLLNWGDTVPPDPIPAGWVNEQPSGLIGQESLDGVLLNWGNGTAPTLAAVPEPGSLLLVASCLVSLGFLGTRALGVKR